MTRTREQLWEGWTELSIKTGSLKWLFQNEYPFKEDEYELWMDEVASMKSYLSALENDSHKFMEIKREESENE